MNSNLVLINLQTGDELKIGDRVTTFRGETGILTGMEAPRHSGSTGRAYVRIDGFEQGFYPSVIDAEFRPRGE